MNGELDTNNIGYYRKGTQEPNLAEHTERGRALLDYASACCEMYIGDSGCKLLQRIEAVDAAKVKAKELGWSDADLEAAEFIGRRMFERMARRRLGLTGR